MIPNSKFLKQDKSFWANVRTISQSLGYTAPEIRPKGAPKSDRGSGRVLVPTTREICGALEGLGLRSTHIADGNGIVTPFGQVLSEYFEFRARALHDDVEPNLMDVDAARALYEETVAKYPSARAAVMNKQKGEKKAPAYLTGLVNVIIEAQLQGLSCNYDPRALTTLTRDGAPLRTLARRVDGAFPDVVNPLAIWEIKEYYYTTTFGSRVADGVYETLLDGLELEEVREHEGINVKHYLIADSRFTWWVCGRSYLCRMVDMLHMGAVDEVIFGREVVTRLPTLVEEWKRDHEARQKFTP